MKIPVIYVGCGGFSLQRLQVLIDGGQFTPVACVEIDIERARIGLDSLKGNVPEGLTEKVYTTITEAKERHNAEVCFIHAAASAHSELVIESLEQDLHTFCVRLSLAIRKNSKRL